MKKRDEENGFQGQKTGIDRDSPTPSPEHMDLLPGQKPCPDRSLLIKFDNKLHKYFFEDSNFMEFISRPLTKIFIKNTLTRINRLNEVRTLPPKNIPLIISGVLLLILSFLLVLSTILCQLLLSGDASRFGSLATGIASFCTFVGGANLLLIAKNKLRKYIDVKMSRVTVIQAFIRKENERDEYLNNGFRWASEKQANGVKLFLFREIPAEKAIFESNHDHNQRFESFEYIVPSVVGALSDDSKSSDFSEIHISYVTIVEDYKFPPRRQKKTRPENLPSQETNLGDKL